MLPPKHRLRRQRDFQRLFRVSRIFRGPTLLFRVGAGGSTSRAGFVISTKVFKNATDRNRLRRQLRAAARELGLPPHKDMAVIATTRSRHKTYESLRHELQSLFQQANRPAPRR